MVADEAGCRWEMTDRRGSRGVGKRAQGVSSGVGFHYWGPTRCGRMWINAPMSGWMWIKRLMSLLSA
jgi:hypothetical protein